MNNDKQQLNSLREQALALLQSKHLTEAQKLFADVCRLDPEDTRAWYMLGTIYGMTGKIDEAGKSFRKVIALQPDHGEAHANLGNVLFYMNRQDEAISHFKTALRINPNNAMAQNNLGNVLKSAGRLHEAIECYRSAIAINPTYAVGHYNLGIALKEAGLLQEAGDAFRQAVELNPNFAEAYNNLGNIFKGQDRLQEARDALQRALSIKPEFAEAIYNLANVNLALGQFGSAIEQYREATLIKPDYADAYNNLGIALNEQGHSETAVETLKIAITIDPKLAAAYNNMGNALRNQGRMTEAQEMVQLALQIQPGFTDAYNNLGTILNWEGKPGDAVAMYQRAVDISPDNVSAHSNLLMTMHYLPSYTPQDLLDAAEEWNSRHTRNIFQLPSPSIYPDPRHKLRIGYVSGDFCSHPVGFFIEAVLSHHDKSNFETYCYYNNNVYDDLNSRLQKLADHWRAIERLSDQSAADLIREDKIDILVDLSGHTQGHRLLVFSRKPAPIQITWMGYFATTGMTAMDYIIADRFVIPPDEERYYTERVERLPEAYLCFTVPTLPIAVVPPPALSKGYVTFGCFNNPAKITSEVIACWSKLLHAVPNARLILKYKSLADNGIKYYFQKAFFDHGINSERIEFSGQSPRGEYLANYNEIDICLDPFPFGGCTTTVEALWMGVPVITLRGNRYVGHMGESIMKNLGLSDCVTETQDAYIERAIGLANNLAQLAELRSRLRQQLVDSPLCNGTKFTRNLENVYRKLWKTWCNAQRHDDH